MIFTAKKAHELLEVLDDVREEYFRGREKEYPYSEWEAKRAVVKERLKRLPEYLRKASEALATQGDARGRPEKLQLEKKAFLFLLTRMLRKSNRGMEEVLELFQPLFDFDVSYKYIERLYSDEEVKLVLHNLFILLVQSEGTSGNFSGDGTGYSLKVEHHYRTQPRKKGKKYLFSFALLDLRTGMYVASGFSRKSEMDAFRKSFVFLEKLGIRVDSVRLDKYYSSRKVLRMFGKKVSVFVIPKKNIAHIGSEWLRVFKRIMESPFAFLNGYFLRNASEGGFSSDKRRYGGGIMQKLEDRQENALFSLALLHNIHAVRITH